MRAEQSERSPFMSLDIIVSPTTPLLLRRIERMSDPIEITRATSRHDSDPPGPQSQTSVATSHTSNANPKGEQMDSDRENQTD